MLLQFRTFTHVLSVTDFIIIIIIITVFIITNYKTSEKTEGVYAHIKQESNPGRVVSALIGWQNR